MQVSKQQVVDFIRQRGDADRAAEAEAELPDTLDLPKDDDLVTKFGVQPLDLAGDEPGPG
ncbi:MAG: hypothetical protein ABIQ59_03405 [Nocardioidaceae bacterium]